MCERKDKRESVDKRTSKDLEAVAIQGPYLDPDSNKQTGKELWHL